MWRIRALATVKDASAKKRNSECLKISIRHGAKIGGAKALFLLKKQIKLPGESFIALGVLGKFILGHQQEHAVGKTSIHGQAAGGSDFSHTRDLSEAINQVRIEPPLSCLRFRVGPVYPGKRHVHDDNFVDAEPRIYLQNLHEAAAEQSRSHHQNQRDGDLCRNNSPADALAVSRAGLSATALIKRLTHVAGCRSYSGER